MRRRRYKDFFGRKRYAVKGKNKGTASDANGEFSIDADKGDILVFTSIGFDPQQITVSGSGAIQVQLTEKSDKLNEVVGNKFKEVMGVFVSNAIKRRELVKVPVEVYWSIALCKENVLEASSPRVRG